MMHGEGNIRPRDPKLAFEALFAEYSDTIYRLCLYKTSDQNTAADLTQETFLRLWKVMGGENRVEKPKQYLYQIARNLIIDHYKKMKPLSLDTLQDEGFDPKSEDPQPGLPTEIALLRNAIESLEDDYREVVYLRFVEDLEIMEIASLLNISANLVSVRINRGKKKLQELFL